MTLTKLQSKINHIMLSLMSRRGHEWRRNQLPKILPRIFSPHTILCLHTALYSFVPTFHPATLAKSSAHNGFVKIHLYLRSNNSINSTLVAILFQILFSLEPTEILSHCYSPALWSLLFEIFLSAFSFIIFWILIHMQWQPIIFFLFLSQGDLPCSKNLTTSSLLKAHSCSAFQSLEPYI